MLFRQMEYLQAVIETGSFYKAADKCSVSQSAISQQINKLEAELGIKLLYRHNRTFSLTPAREHFYRKSLIITSDAEQLLREIKDIAEKNRTNMRLGYYKGYHGSELSETIAGFSEKYPSIDVSIMVGSHEELYKALVNGTVDLILNDQRRAFSDVYYNEILSESRVYIEISNRNPLSRMETIEISELKNMPCILVINSSAQQEEQQYYEDIVGIKGDYQFADSIQEARLLIISGQGYMPVDVIGNNEWFDSSINRIPLTRNGEPIRKIYCAFWRKDNSGYYIEDFADMLRKHF